jgi:predicted RND superfamily exporter protein
MAAFYDQFGAMNVDGVGTVHPSASGFILVEVVRAVQRDGVMMAVLSLLVVLVVLFIDFKRIAATALVFAPLLLGLIWTAGIMGFAGMKLGLYNMLVLPLLLGVGIDATVHLYHSWREQGPGSLRLVLKETGLAIVVSSATTAVGFVGMSIVSHLGLRTIGLLAIVGITTCLISALTVLPVLLSLIEQRQNRSSSHHARTDVPLS